MKKGIVIGLLSGIVLLGCNSGGGSSSTSAPVTGHAYITNLGYYPNYSNSYTECNVTANGIDPNSCTTTTPSGTGALTEPFAIAINGNYAYIVNNTSSGSYTQCGINSNSIDASSCNTVTPSGSGAMSYPEGIIFNANYAYFTNDLGNYADSYTQCAVNGNGINSNSCTTITPTGAGALNGPGQLAINGNYAYIPNWNSNSYTQCSIGAGGIESATCNTITPSGSGALDSPEAVAFNGNYAYFTNGGNFNSHTGSYTQCSISGAVIESNTCNTITLNGSAKLSNPIGIAFNGGYAYFINSYTNGYTQCTVGSNGINPTSCTGITPSGANALSYPIGIVFQ